MLHDRPGLPLSAFLYLLGAIWLGATAQAEDSVRIELGDGSIVSGDLVTLEQGVAVLSSASLGRLEIPAGQIRSMRREDVAPTEPRPARDEQQLQTAPVDGIENAIAEEMGASALGMRLHDDPLVMEILADGELMAHIERADLDLLLGDLRLESLRTEGSR